VNLDALGRTECAVPLDVQQSFWRLSSSGNVRWGLVRGWRRLDEGFWKEVSSASVRLATESSMSFVLIFASRMLSRSS